MSVATRVITALVMALLASAASAPAEAAKTLTLSSQWPENTVSSQVNRWWAEQIEARSNGALTVRIFYAGALATAGENLDLVRSGGVELVNMSPSYFGADLPLYSAPNSIPMAMSEVDQATELMARLAAEVPALDQEAARNGVKALFFHHLNPYRLVCREPVSGLEDLAGKKIRTWGSDMPRMVEAAGAVPVSLGLAELYEGLSRGVVDCIPFSVDLMVNFKIYEVAQHVHDVTLWLGPTSGIWMNRDAWDALAPDEQALLERVSAEAALRDRDLTKQAAEAAIETLTEQGVRFHPFPDADKLAWRAANPDFFGDFIASQAQVGQGDAAQAMVRIWRAVTGG